MDLESTQLISFQTVKVSIRAGLNGGMRELINEAFLEGCFDPSTYSRGADYVRQKRVLHANYGKDGLIKGRVRGSTIYLQEIRIESNGEGISISAECDCPVGENCKHCVAVLLTLLQRGELVHSVPAVQELSWQARPNHEFDTWARALSKELHQVRSRRHAGKTEEVRYVLYHDATIEVFHIKRLLSGTWGRPTKFPFYGSVPSQWPEYVNDGDILIIKGFARNLPLRSHSKAHFLMKGEEASRLLKLAVETGRCHWEDPLSQPLRFAECREARFVWVELPNANQRLELQVKAGIPVSVDPPWFVDLQTHEAGPLDTGLSPLVAEHLQMVPELRPEGVPAVRERMLALMPEHPEMAPRSLKQVVFKQFDPKPVLKVNRLKCDFSLWTHRRGEAVRYSAIVSNLMFDYGGARLDLNFRDPEVRVVNGDSVQIAPRSNDAETAILRLLSENGWRRRGFTQGWNLPPGYEFVLNVDTSGLTETRLDNAYYDFLRRQKPYLEARGWIVEVEDAPIIRTDRDVDWLIGLHENDHDWFSLQLGIIVDGERLDIRPLLVDIIESVTRGGQRSLLDVQDDEDFYVQIDATRVVALSAARLKPLLQTLLELFGPTESWSEELSFPGNRISELELLDRAADSGAFSLENPDSFKKLKARSAAFQALEPIFPPSEFCGELRPYQAFGLAWLQFLREYEFGGILADDMGLGKTIQTLAHIQTEKEAGRLTQPALIVAPTSTLPNWRREAEKFTPSLSTILFHGAERKESNRSLARADLVITSYALLVRDREKLLSQDWHLIVLDEAQNIKNPTTAMAKAACELKAKHRICLSGTPVENNLDELWSLFHFTMPGFLGKNSSFKREYRNAIEQHRDKGAASRLARRIKPFLLRRTKEAVATELPPKTEIVVPVELEGAQRDLYESVRLAMDKRVRDLLSTKGLSRSHLEILDALLKLRQICCDPRLVKLEAAEGVFTTSKLDRLMEMLEELGQEGRKVLVFSQFTSMLDLMEVRLKELQMNWVRISGETKDRETPVQRFQAGEAPIFLISLKAGGTGLNLTAADTVIHYDPWWNPAVERQATDRAHRIGQSKAVFVYKLIAAGSVEEKILDLQAKKGEIARAILEGNEDSIEKLSADDLKWIFES